MEDTETHAMGDLDPRFALNLRTRNGSDIHWKATELCFAQAGCQH